MNVEPEKIISELSDEEHTDTKKNAKTFLQKFRWQIISGILAILLILSWILGIQFDFSSPKYNWSTRNTTPINENTKNNENTATTNGSSNSSNTQQDTQQTKQQNKQQGNNQQPPKPEDVMIGEVNIEPDDNVFLGDENAPITVIEFTDYECPYCRYHFDETFQKIKEQYIDTGKVRYTVRDFPLEFHPFAQTSAEATECAEDEGKFWEYRNVLFSQPYPENVDELPKHLTGIAEYLDLNIDRFQTCLESQKYEEEVHQDREEGINIGVTGTPGFIINGKLFSGALPYETFEMIFKELLKE